MVITCLYLPKDIALAESRLRLLDLGELDVEAPQFGRIAIAEIGPEQIPPLALTDLAQLLSIELEAQRRGDGRVRVLAR